jgi:acyl carrier protein
LAEIDRTRAALVRFIGTIARPGQSAEGLADDRNLIDAGVIDSLAMVQVILYLEKEHGVDLLKAGFDPAELASVAGILRVIDSARQ